MSVHVNVLMSKIKRTYICDVRQLSNSAFTSPACHYTVILNLRSFFAIKRGKEKYKLLINVEWLFFNMYIVGNKVKGRISKWLIEENKAHQFSEKRRFLTP